MLRITILSGGRAGTRVELQKPVVTIGRALDSDVALDPNGDLDASARHAEIRAEATGYVIVDMQSRNGIFLPARGMQRLSREPVLVNEQIQLGPTGPRVGIEVLAPPPLASTQPTGYASNPPGPPSYAPGQPPGLAALPALPNFARAGDPNAPPNTGQKKPMGQQTLLAHVGAMIAQQGQGAIDRRHAGVRR